MSRAWSAIHHATFADSHEYGEAVERPVQLSGWSVARDATVSGLAFVSYLGEKMKKAPF
jgi:hypothetical protein